MSAQTTLHQEPQFSKLRAAIWPIQGSEMKKFLPMGMMMFLILFNYTILRDTKDTLIVGAAGAEAISFLKFWGVTPSSILFVILYAKLSNILSKENLFYACLIPFIIFFGAFAFFIYPNKEWLHPSPEHVDAMKQSIPALRFIFALWGSWSYSIFYIMSELWGSVVVSLLFWQFANEITRTREATFLSSVSSSWKYRFNVYQVQQFTIYQKLTISILRRFGCLGNQLELSDGNRCVAGLLCIAIYWWMNRNVLTDPFYYEAAAMPKKVKKEKPKLSIVKALSTCLHLVILALLPFSFWDTEWPLTLSKSHGKVNLNFSIPLISRKRLQLLHGESSLRLQVLQRSF